MKIKLSVIVPCFNEEKRFIEGAAHYINYLSKINYSWELILVNDGSNDNTLKLMSGLAQKHKNIKVVSYKENRGKGYAIVQGVKKALGKYILFSDLDHAVSIDTIEDFYKYFESGAKLVIGSRRVKGAKFLKRQHILRESLGRGFTFLVRLFVDWKIKDATCGFKAFENKVAKRLFSKISIYGWAFDAEILYLCKKYNINHIQAPVSWSDVKGSKVSLFRDVVRSLGGLVTIRLNDIRNKY